MANAEASFEVTTRAIRPGGTAPEVTAPGDTAPVVTTPGVIAPGGVAPEDTGPEETAPEVTASTATADFGDFVKDDDEELDLEEVAEPWERYDADDNRHVFYPIFLGELLNERYLVEHKLGFGGGSTVWMAFDMKDKTDVALKVMALGEWADNEIRIQDEIIKKVQDASRLVIYTETFLLPRDDGRCHRVLVFPMKGPSICTLSLKRIPMAARVSAARQFLVTVANLHEAGILHRGDSILSHLYFLYTLFSTILA
ncbi:unnamed protein product [Penicillium salamii]|nr:unnamed protein product [Penicillium salamii]CAG8423676.1 unnamed protein product [Penicillium salamii]